MDSEDEETKEPRAVATGRLGGMVHSEAKRLIGIRRHARVRCGSGLSTLWGGEFSAPPEDVGGVSRYEEFLEAGVFHYWPRGARGGEDPGRTIIQPP
jgi:hypothetical protein